MDFSFLEERKRSKIIEHYPVLGSLQLPHMPWGDQPAMVRILVVADVSLLSAGDLAEYAIHNRREDFERVDAILACGPFCRPEDLRPYLINPNQRTDTPELQAALTGLWTAALSQLESIECRVVYVGGPNDPDIEERQRLTPNAVNVQHQWMPLVAGLGCAGLHTSKESSEDEKPSSSPSTSPRRYVALDREQLWRRARPSSC